jgi:hypothetical protein
MSEKEEEIACHSIDTYKERDKRESKRERERERERRNEEILLVSSRA